LDAVTKALTAVGIALVVFMGGLGLAVYLTRDEDYIAVDNLLAEKLSKAIGTAQDRGADVDLAREANFDWDRVLITEPGLEPARISQRLGSEWKGRNNSFAAGAPLFIFVRDGKVVRFADYRGEGRFEGFERPIAELPRARAALRVRDLVITPAPGSSSSG
jgi:hypothetical protein